MLVTGDLNSRIGSGKLEEFIPAIDTLLPDQRFPNSSRSSCDSTVNEYGKKLNRICNSFNLKVANGQIPGDFLGNYTSFNYKGCSVVDLVITDYDFFNYLDRLTVLPPDFNSSHAPISLNIQCNMKRETSRTDSELGNLPSKIIWDDDKTEEFIKILKNSEVHNRISLLTENIANANTDHNIVENTLEEFSNILVDKASRCMKLVNNKHKPKVSTKPRSKKWYDVECANVKKKFTTAAKLLQHNPGNPFARGSYMKLKKDYRKLLKKKKMIFESDSISMLEKLSSDPKAFWNHVKYLRSASNNTNNKSLAVSADTWVDHFTLLNKRNPSLNTDNSHVQRVLSELESRFHSDTIVSDLLDRKFNVDEVENGIKRLKAGKATGMDAVSNNILKCASKLLSPFITNLFNCILHSEIFPEAWGLGIIVPLFKSGEPEDPNNYRGISINSCISKLFTMLLNDRLTNFTEVNHTIHFNQLGFRKGFRTADHVFTLKTIIDKTMKDKKNLHVCFVDFKKAYDTVWRDGLFLKLFNNNVSSKFVNLLQSMYKSLRCCVKLPTGLSQPFASLAGLRQGCNLSPLLFNIFINDFINCLSEIKSDCPVLNGIPISCLLYADDLILISETKQGLQALLDCLHDFSNKWFLEVNTTKTKSMIFSRKRNKPENRFVFGDIDLPTCNSYCYLGCVVSQNGSFKSAAHTLYEKATKSMYGLFNSLYRYQTCTFDTMINLFDRLISPISLYNSEV